MGFVDLRPVTEDPFPASAVHADHLTYRDPYHWNLFGYRRYGPRVVERLAAIGHGALIPAQ